MEEKLEKLRDLVKVQCSNGNWDYDPYMHGMANGMILCMALLEGKEPEYLEAPDQWLFNRPPPMVQTEMVLDEASHGE